MHTGACELDPLDTSGVGHLHGLTHRRLAASSPAIRRGRTIGVARTTRAFPAPGPGKRSGNPARERGDRGIGEHSRETAVEARLETSQALHDWKTSACAGEGEAVILNSTVQYQTTTDRAFAALGDPTRRAVLERLGAGSATISELAEPFGMSLTGMKKHVRVLEEAELVTTEKVGRVRSCTLAPYAIEGISTWLQRLDRFAQVVERTKGAR